MTTLPPLLKLRGGYGKGVALIEGQILVVSQMLDGVACILGPSHSETLGKFRHWSWADNPLSLTEIPERHCCHH